ncbi:molybdopterin-dependent oxidoreductase [Halalkalibacterium ligniniphilum]|uniref:molybdopterin-dependent oxidoreductase n=1 Tax=Halalkalibacterium ligniniphilum TaxID=1134413 RepID=UPI000348549C|nr:molybdopterin-dependent oxidoreductase [Halalkalibacterium ligniniphilum]
MERINKSVCPHNCPDTCGLMVTVEDQKLKRLTGDKQHPVTKGVICEKIRNGYIEKIYGKDRLLRPLKRKGKKGSGDFQEISWDEAIDEIVATYQRILEQHGSRSILPYSYSGTIGVIQNGSMDRRFFNRLGSAVLDRTICSAAGNAAFVYTMGAQVGVNPEETVEAKLIIVWGGNIVLSNMHQWLYIREAKKRGAFVIVVDVEENETARQADWFIQIKPGTDAALALGIMNILVKNKWYDSSFLKKHTTGVEELFDHVKDYEVERVAAITGVKPMDIIKLANRYGAESRSFIRIGNGQQHHRCGGMSTRAILCLPALVGAWQYRGCGALFFNLKQGELFSDILQRTDLRKEKARVVNMNQIGEALLNKEQPIYSLFVYNSNPAAVAQGQTKLLEGLMREDLFTVVHDQRLTDTARFADLVLPATTAFEHGDLYRSYWHRYWQMSKPVISPIGESKSNTDLFRLLAKAFGFTDPCFQEEDEALMQQALFGELPINAVIWDTFKSGKPVKFEAKASLSEMEPWVDGKYETPSQKIELYSEKMKQEGLFPLPLYEEEKGSKHRFSLITPPHRLGLNSQFIDKTKEEPRLEIHVDDAAFFNIQDGNWIRIWNENGEVKCRATVSTRTQQGVLIGRGVWWHRNFQGKGNFNRLTSSQLSDMGGGATFFSTTVSVEKI